MVPLIVLVLVLAVGGGVVFLVKSKRSTPDEAGIGPNEFLQSPPSSFPVTPEPTRALDPATPAPAAANFIPRATDSATPVPAETLPAATVDETEDDDNDDDIDDEVVASRFKAPGSRSMGAPIAGGLTVVPPVYPLEGPRPEPELEPELEPEPEDAVEVEASAEEEAVDVEAEIEQVAEVEPDLEVEQVAEDEPAAESVVEAELESDSEPEPEPEDEAVVVEVEVEPAEGPPVPTLSLVRTDTVIDLVEAEAAESEQSGGPDVSDDDVWHDVVLQPEPDAVDHVLQALINRARFTQVAVEAVATELVERADLQGQEVSDVLAELVGRAADDPTLDEARTSELTLFNDEVPSRPGQLADFAKLSPGDKKRIIIRVLCLLVARSEDQQLPPRAEGEASEPRAWPLARAVWPLSASDDDGESQLPSRRLAKSG